MLGRARIGWGVVTNQLRRAPHYRGALFAVFPLIVAVVAQALLAVDRFTIPILLFAAASLFFLSAFRQQTNLLQRQVVGQPLTHLTNPYWLLFAALAVGLSLASLIPLDVEQPTQRFWWLYLASILALVIGATVADWTTISIRHLSSQIVASMQRRKLWWRSIVPLAILLGGAAALRLHNLDQLPYGTWYDEAANGLEALRMSREPAFRPLYTAGVNSAGHYLFLVLGSIRLFGIETFSIRLVSALMGVLAVGGSYLLGREVSGHRFGLILALLFATSRWSINFSRLGMYNISTPLFQFVALALLLRAYRRGSIASYALSGVALGLGLTFYSAFQLFLPVVGAVIVVLLSQAREQATVVSSSTNVHSFPSYAGNLPILVTRFRTLLQSEMRSLLLGLLVLLVALSITVAPLAMFAIHKPDVFLSRVQKTALFSDKLPEERWPALVRNVRKHLLMFNVQGDPNGRHNLPGEPMLDPISGGLFILGLLYCMVAWRLRYPIVWVIWLGAGLLGGILSLDFEAPQSLRSIGAFPAAMIIVAMPVHAVWQRAEQHERVVSLRWSLRLAVASTLFAIALINIRGYFFTQARDFATWNAFSTPETIAARLLLAQPESSDKYVISLYSDHPTIRFLTYGKELTYHTIDTTAQLPILQPADREISLILDADRKEIFEEAKSVYPGARFEEIKPPNGGPTVVYHAQISSLAAAEIQGLTATYYAGSRWQGDPVYTEIDPDIRENWPANAPLPMPFVAEWNGVLAVDEYGAYQFFIQSPAQIQLYVDENLILASETAVEEPLSAGVVLARGRHTFRLRAAGGVGSLVMGWRTPRAGPETIPTWHFYRRPVQAMGLLGTYYPNGSWSSPEAFKEINQRFNMYFHIPRLTRPYTVRWTGKLIAPVSGQYTFGLQSIDEAILKLNGYEVVASPTKNVYAESTIDLEQGLHDIELHYADRTDHTYISLFWQPPDTPPGTPRQIIPPELLVPPQASYELLDLPSIADITFDSATGVAVTVSPKAEPAAVEIVATNLAEPRAVAVSTDRLFVAETTAHHVRMLDLDGRSLGLIRHPDQPFAQPFAVAVTSDEQLVVLDAGLARVSVFSLEGEYVTDIPIPGEFSGRARGMDVDKFGNIWLANTPGGRILAFDAAGRKVREVEHTAGGSEWAGGQPVDVLHSTTGDTYVVDAGYHQLVRYDGQGRRLLSWNIAQANTMDGAHLASDAAGHLYLTDPEGGLVIQLTEAGDRQAVWSVRDEDTNDAKPVGIAVDARGVIWIADPTGGRLLKLQPLDSDAQQ